MPGVKAFWWYTSLRFGLLVASYLVLWLVGLLFWDVAAPWRLGVSHNLLTLFAALVVSSLAALITLNRQRDRLAENIQHRAEQMQERIEESRRAEDVD